MGRKQRRLVKRELKALAGRLLAVLIREEGCTILLPTDGVDATPEETREIAVEVLAELGCTQWKKAA